MIRHIFRKDWKLLWQMAAGAGAANVVQRLMLARAQQTGDQNLLQLATGFGLAALVATGILIVMVVQQDPLPGLCQDWLVRPIRRRDLFLSKLLFVVLVVQGPIWVAEVVQGLMAGLPLGPSVGVALARSFWMLVAMDLPCMALAALTRNLVQPIGTAVAAFAGFVFFYSSIGGAPPTRWTRVAWVTDWSQVGWGLAAAALILTLEYRRRKTVPARWAFGAAAVIWIAMELLPVGAAFAVQDSLSHRVAEVNQVGIAFDPGAGKEPGLRWNRVGERVNGGFREHEIGISLPVRISGLGDGRMVMLDRARVRLTDSLGKAVSMGLGEEANLANIPQEGGIRQRIVIPEAVYERVRDQPLRMEIDYWLTLLAADSAQTIPALDGDRWVAGLGRCKARPGASGGKVDVHCVAPGRLPCVDWFLEDEKNGQRVAPEKRILPFPLAAVPGNACRPDYAPWATGIGGDPAVPFDATFRWSAPDPQSTRLVAVVYRPEAHFTRRVVIPEIRLGEW